MTKDEVLKLAVEAGAYSPDNPDDYAFSVEELYRFADLVVAAERAKVYAAQEDPCPGCRKGGVCRTPKCGRLKLPADHPFRFERPEQEPVGTVKELFTQAAWEKHDLRGSTKVYTTPPHRKPLTADEIDVLVMDSDGTPNSHLEFARAIEAAHGIKE